MTAAFGYSMPIEYFKKAAMASGDFSSRARAPVCAAMGGPVGSGRRGHKGSSSAGLRARSKPAVKRNATSTAVGPKTTVKINKLPRTGRSAPEGSSKQLEGLGSSITQRGSQGGKSMNNGSSYNITYAYMPESCFEEFLRSSKDGVGSGVEAFAKAIQLGMARGDARMTREALRRYIHIMRILAISEDICLEMEDCALVLTAGKGEVSAEDRKATYRVLEENLKQLVMTTVALKRATSEAQAIKQDMAQLQLNAAKHAPSTAATTYDSVKYKNSAAAVAAYDAKYGGDAPARMTEAKRLCRQQRAPPPPQQQRCKQSRLLSAVEALLAQDQVASNKRTSGGNSSTSSSKGGNPFMVDRQQLLQQEKLNSASSTTKPNSMVPARGNRWGSQGRPAPFGINNNAGVATGGASLVKLGSSGGHHGLVCNLAGEDDLDLQDVIRELEIVEGRISEASTYQLAKQWKARKLALLDRMTALLTFNNSADADDDEVPTPPAVTISATPFSSTAGNSYTNNVNNGSEAFGYAAVSLAYDNRAIAMASLLAAGSQVPLYAPYWLWALKAWATRSARLPVKSTSQHASIINNCIMSYTNAGGTGSGAMPGSTQLLLPSKCSVVSHPINITCDDDDEDGALEMTSNDNIMNNIVALSSIEEEEDKEEQIMTTIITTCIKATAATSTSNTIDSAASTSNAEGKSSKHGWGKLRTAAAAVVGVAAQLVCWGAW